MNQSLMKKILLVLGAAIVMMVIGLAIYVQAVKPQETRQNRLLLNDALFKAIHSKQTVSAHPLSIDVDIKTNRLYLSTNQRIIKEYIVSTGKQSSMTPVGEYKIGYKGFPKPDWSPSDPTMLGTRWMEFNRVKGGEMFGIHGTNEPHLIGLAVSHGCVRMRNKDVEELFELVPKGTKVTIRQSHTKDFLKIEGAKETACLTC